MTKICIPVVKVIKSVKLTCKVHSVNDHLSVKSVEVRNEVPLFSLSHLLFPNKCVHKVQLLNVPQEAHYLLSENEHFARGFYVPKQLRANMSKNQTFSKYHGNSQKLNSPHILSFGRPWCETNHGMLRLAEY